MLSSPPGRVKLLIPTVQRFFKNQFFPSRKGGGNYPMFQKRLWKRLQCIRKWCENDSADRFFRFISIGDGIIKYVERCSQDSPQTYKMKGFAAIKAVLTIVAKLSILDIYRGPGYTSNVLKVSLPPEISLSSFKFAYVFIVLLVFPRSLW